MPFLTFVLVATIAFASTPVLAQDRQLPAEQQQLLSKLPPAQRQQALDAIRQVQGQQAVSTQKTINEVVSQPGLMPAGSPVNQPLGVAEPTADAGSRLILSFSPLNSLTAEQKKELVEDAVLQNLIGNHFYVLDDSGVLSLQGLERIPLLGLTETSISQRLAAESYLSAFDIEAQILRQEPIGVEALEPFGYGVFESHAATFDAPISGPVPSDYVLGPGDTVHVQLFGNVNGIYEYEISRDGVLSLPEIGPVTVAGISFSEFRADLKKRVQEMLIGTQVSVTMGQLRTIRVFILGDVNEPGSYVIGGLATISSALYASGGITRVGSLRNIQLKRSGRLVTTLDLYDLLLNGNTAGDSRLQPGDVIFVPPIGKTIGVAGAVKRPAVYEVKTHASVHDAMRLSGGLAADALGQYAHLERIAESGERVVLSVNLDIDDLRSLRVRAGDVLLVPEVSKELRGAVTLSGFVQRPGVYQWRKNMRLTDLIQSVRDLKSGVDTEYVLIRRKGRSAVAIEVLSANLAAALLEPSGPENVRLEAGDTVYVFSLAIGPQRVVGPLIEELELHADIESPVKRVQIVGSVRSPGKYPLVPGMRVSDLIRAGGNLSEKAYPIEAEITRYSTAGRGARDIEVLNVNLDAIRKGVASADLLLRPHDYLIIKQLPEWDTLWTVSLVGELRFPGEYRVRRGETLSELIDRAGGLTESAFAEGAIFLRESLKEQEQEQIELLTRRMEADLASLSLESATSGNSDAMMTGKVLLDQLRGTEAAGRLVIDIERAASDMGRSAAAIELKDGDKLLVPSHTPVVTVLGETQQNTSHLFLENLSRDDYIDLSGGFTRRADKKLIYVVRANGAVIAGSRSKWLGRGGNVSIRPGDTIVVPLDTDRMRPLTFWTNVTQILYQGAIAIAAIKTFDN